MSTYKLQLLVSPTLLAQLDAAAERDHPGAGNRSGTGVRLLAWALAHDAARAATMAPAAPPPLPAPAAEPPRRLRWARTRGSAEAALANKVPSKIDGEHFVLVEVEAEAPGDPSVYVRAVPYVKAGAPS
jgi:hypothetical protein